MEGCKCGPESIAVHYHTSHGPEEKDAVHESTDEKVQPEHRENKAAQRKSDEERPPENVAKKAAEDDDGVPYDKGYAWICLLSTFIMTAIVVGAFLKSFGVFFTTIVERYHTTARATSWITSLYMAFTLCTGVLAATVYITITGTEYNAPACFNFSDTLAGGLTRISSPARKGPVVPVLVGLIDLRILVVIGGLLTGCGVLLTAFVTRVEYMYLTYGVMAGIGSGLCLNLCMTTMSRYFKKRLGLANGLAAAGSSIGAFVLPPLFSIILDHYGFLGAFMLFASFGFHLCICGALLRPPEQYMKRQRKRTDQPKSPAHNEVQQRSFNITSLFLGVNVLDVRTPNAEEPETLKFPTLQSGLKAILDGKIGPDGTPSAAANGGQSKCRCCSWRCSQRATSGDASRTSGRVNVDFSLLKERVFWIYVVVIVFTFTAFPSMFYMITAHAEQLGYTKTQAAFLLSVHGGTDFVGRVLFGFVADTEFMRTSLLFSLNLGLVAVTCFLFPISKNYIFLVVASALNGLTIGSFIPLLPSLLVKAFGSKRLAGSFGLITFCVGIAMILGAPVVGFLRDKTGNWHATFYMVGCFTAIGALTMMLDLTVTPPKCITDRKNKQQCKEMSAVETDDRTLEHNNEKPEKSKAPSNEKSGVEQNKKTLFDGSHENNDVSLLQMNGFPSSAEGRDVHCTGSGVLSGGSDIVAYWKPNSSSDGSYTNKAFVVNVCAL